MSTKKKKKNLKNKKALRPEMVLEYLQRRGEPISTRTVAEHFGRRGHDARDQVYAILSGLSKDGQLKQLRKHQWCAPENVKVLRGRVVGHAEGHGQVIPDDGGDPIRLRQHDMSEVLHGDRVQVRVTGFDRRKRRFGSIVEVTERGNQEVVGRYFNEKNVGFVVPNDQRIAQDIFIAPDDRNSAKNGEVVVAEVIKQPSKSFQPIGRVREILGEHMAPGMEIEIAIRKHELPHVWPGAVTAECEKFDDLVTLKDPGRREDLRSMPLVTIDGEDARDFDDAVYCEPANGGWRLLVAIADVSHYVSSASALDAEALVRGNSVYFPQRVIPMLPEVLSNGLCSLRPDVDRLCLVCDMAIDNAGIVQNSRFYEAVMHSHARLTYAQVADLIEGHAADGSDAIPGRLAPQIMNLQKLARLLGKARRRDGTIEFEVPEAQIIFNEDDKIERIIARTRNDAHRLIEEMMLAANRCAADYVDSSDAPGIFRVHESPDPEKVKDLRRFLGLYGANLGGGEKPGPADYGAALSQILSKPDAERSAGIVQTAMLRSMKQAIYSSDNAGHFALGFDSYTHFTSPIRRYTDLYIHRAIKHLVYKDGFEISPASEGYAEQTAIQCSMTERRADDATRDAIQWLKCEFMSHRLGEEFDARVSTVTDFGIFVELKDFFVDGLVHITQMGDEYFRFDGEHRQLHGEQSGKVYKLGQEVRVVLTKVDMELARIDFDLVGAFRRGKKSRSRRGKSR